LRNLWLLALRQESNFNIFKNLFLEYMDLRGRKYYKDEGKCTRSSIIFKVNQLLWGCLIAGGSNV